MRFHLTKTLVVASVAIAPIFVSSGTAFAAGLPSQAPIAATGTDVNPYGSPNVFIPASQMLQDALETAEYSAAQACSSGAIRMKHLVITSESFQQDTSQQTETATVTIHTRCW